MCVKVIRLTRNESRKLITKREIRPRSRLELFPLVYSSSTKKPSYFAILFKLLSPLCFGYECKLSGQFRPKLTAINLR